MFDFHIVDFSKLNTIIDISIAAFLIITVIYLCVRFRFNRYAIIALTVLMFLMVVAWVLALDVTMHFFFIIITIFMFILCISHTGAIRSMFAKKPGSILTRKSKPDKIVDRQALYEEVGRAVIACSKQKIGALITFEKNDKLNDNDNKISLWKDVFKRIKTRKITRLQTVNRQKACKFTSFY